MLSMSNKSINIVQALQLRAMIFLFFYLSLEFSRLFVFSGVNLYPLMAMWGVVFSELTTIIILHLLYGTTGVGRDVNTLNFYGVVFHLLYIPFYCYGIDFSTEHNNASKCINALIVGRLLLPLSPDLLRRIALLDYAKDWFHAHRLFVSQYVNGLTISIFILCALPLFIMIYLTNTDQMRITGIAIVLFAFFIAIESAKKAAPPAEPPQPRSINEEDSALSKAAGQEPSFDRREFLVTLFVAVIVAFVLVNFRPSDTAKDRAYLTGYASGYSDGKNGVKPKSSVRLNKLLYCQLVFDPKETRDFGKAPHECDPEHFDQ